jgi:uncharacterized protein (DUF2141 family)
MLRWSASRTSFVGALFASLMVLPSSPWPAAAQVLEAKPVTISGRVLGASGKHTVRVALWSSAALFVEPVQLAVIPPGRPTDFAFSVPAGEWAVSAFEDVNENGKLDLGLFGPKEPSGFWRVFKAWRKPAFKDVSMSVTRDMPGVEVHLK